MKRQGFTLVELLVVISIISLLLSLVLPAFSEVRWQAREASVKTTINVLGQSVEQFNNDMSFYPESGLRTVPNNKILNENQNGPNFQIGNGTVVDQGAHRLAESLAGYDRQGYQKDHYYQIYQEGGSTVPSSVKEGDPIAWNQYINSMDKTKRFGPYVDINKIKFGPMKDASKIDGQNKSFYWKDTELNLNSVILDDMDPERPRAILYYRANRSKTTIPTIYSYADNYYITEDKDVSTPYYPDFYKGVAYNTLSTITSNSQISYGAGQKSFELFIWDKETGRDPTGVYQPDKASARPCNKDTFLLIAAGRDGLYGTDDDITNFKRAKD